MLVETTKQNSDVADDRPSVPPDAAEVDRHVDEHERRIAERQGKQFQLLKDQAHALFGTLDGRPGVMSMVDLQKLLEKAGDDLGSGRFIVRCLGAERYLDVGTVAVLITLRQNLIAERSRPTTADIMMIDAAVVAYYNFLRVQSWIGNLALVVEREAFGQASLNEIHGPTVGEQTELNVLRPEDEMAAYERLIGDAMIGDTTLFARQDSAEAQSRIVDPILGAPTPIHEYDPGTWGPDEAIAIAAEVGGWYDPRVSAPQGGAP